MNPCVARFVFKTEDKDSSEKVFIIQLGRRISEPTNEGKEGVAN
jgi:hypothetical protein